MHILILFLTVKFWFTTSLKKCYIWENIIGGMKENILKKAGKYNKRVGNNPDEILIIYQVMHKQPYSHLHIKMEQVLFLPI